MKFLILIVLYFIGQYAYTQNIPVVKKIEVKYITKKPKKDKYDFAWSKEFDEFGNLKKYSFHNFGVTVNTNYRYDSTGQIISYDSNSDMDNGDIIKSTVNFYFSQDTVIRSERFVINDTVFEFEKTKTISDIHGNLILKKGSKTNSIDTYEKHSYIYDSKGRILVDSNCTNYPECKLSYYIWTKEGLTINRVRDISERTPNNPTADTTWFLEKYKFHSNDSISSLETSGYSTLNGETGFKQYFRYDTLGNCIEFYILVPKKPNKKHNHQLFQYTYNKHGLVMSKKIVTIKSILTRKSIKCQYAYEYW